MYGQLKFANVVREYREISSQVAQVRTFIGLQMTQKHHCCPDGGKPISSQISFRLKV